MFFQLQARRINRELGQWLKFNCYSSSKKSCGIAQCYLPAISNECSPPNPSQSGWYSIYLPRRDGRL